MANTKIHHPLRKCVICLTRIGLGSKRIGMVMGKNHSLISKWRRKAGIPGQEKKVNAYWRARHKSGQQNSRGKPRKQRHLLPEVLAMIQQRLTEKAIMLEYRKETRASKRPDTLWSDHKVAQRWAEKNRRQSDWKYRAMFYARKRVRNFLYQNSRPKSFSITAAIGCSPDELRLHLQSKFKPGMHWNNHGLWHIDHIVPLASAQTPEQIIALCHYTNLQPLWAADNIRKGDKMLRQASFLYAQ